MYMHDSIFIAAEKAKFRFVNLHNISREILIALQIISFLIIISINSLVIIKICIICVSIKTNLCLSPAKADTKSGSINNKKFGKENMLENSIVS